MNIQMPLTIRSNDALVLLKVNLDGEHHLLNQAMRKIAFLYKRCSEQSIYSYLKLMETKKDIEKISAQVKKLKRYISKKIMSQSIPAGNVTYPIHTIENIIVGTPLHYELFNLVKTFDDTACLIRLARNVSLFNEPRDFYKKRKELKQQIFNLTTKIACLKTQQLPTTTFNDYFEKNDSYHDAVKAYGEVDPTLLFLALQSPIAPIISAKELNQWSVNLQQLAVNNEK